MMMGAICASMHAIQRKDSTVTAQKISHMNIVVDKMHMAGHVDSWCKEHCDPRKCKELDEVY